MAQKLTFVGNVLCKSFAKKTILRHFYVSLKSESYYQVLLNMLCGMQ